MILVQVALPLYSVFMESSIGKCVGRLLPTNMPALMHLELLMSQFEHILLMATTSTASVSLMGATHVITSGHLLQLLMRWEHIQTSTVFAPILTLLAWRHHHPALLGMTTFVTLAVQIDGYIYFTQMIPYGMELVVDQPIPAAL